MAILFKNNAASTLDYMYQAPDKDFVDIYVVDPTVFPTIASGSDDYFYLTLVGENALEIVKVFAQITNVNTGKLAFRSYRAQEGTTAQEWTKGTRIEMRITAEALESFVPTAVQLAQDNLDAVGVASTTNVGFAGVDGKTTKADAEGVITAKDVAIGGDLADLATARGQLGPAKELGSGVDYNTVTEAGFYLIDAAGGVNGPLKGSAIYLHVFYSKKDALAKNLYQIAYAYSTTRDRVFVRQYRTASKDWSSWSEIISSASIGDGIRINNGIISVPEYKGATASTAGTSGLVPPAAAGEQERFLTGGGEYKPALSTKGGLLTGSVQMNDTANVISTAPAANTDQGLFLADKNGAVMGGFDTIQRASDNVKWTQLFSKSSKGNVASIAAVAHEDGTGEIITYNPLLLNTTQLKEIIDNGNRVFMLSGDNSKPGYTFKFSPDTGEAYMDGRVIHAKADTAGYADTAGSAPANGGTAWAANRLRREGGVDTVWNWAGQGGQPSWLWGGNDGVSMYVYNPSNFSVNYANSANYATSANYANSAGSVSGLGGARVSGVVSRCGDEICVHAPAGGQYLILYGQRVAVTNGHRGGELYATLSPGIYAGGGHLGQTGNRENDDAHMVAYAGELYRV